MPGNLSHTITDADICREYGTATLSITLVLLFSLSLIIFYGARVSFTEQKISANEYRTKQAYEAAQAGLEIGVTSLNQRDARVQIIVDQDNDGIIDSAQINNSSDVLANNAGYAIIYTNARWPGNYGLIEIKSTGWSDDHSATATLTRIMQLVPLLLNPPDAGITGHGDFDMDGNIELINTITGLNARSGGIITLNGGVHTITSIPGADGITENDPELRDLHNNDDYFLHFFGSNKTDTQNQSIQLICDTSSCKDQNDHFVNIAELPGENIWLSGNATIAANIGSEEQPVILVIDGDLVLAGDLEIWGLIYVTQSGHTVNVPGKVKIHGALMVESADIRASGNLVIAYDQNVLVPPKGGHGLFARVPGSWRDF